MSKFFKQQGLILDGEDYSRGRNSDMESRKLQDEINGLKKRKTGNFIHKIALNKLFLYTGNTFLPVCILFICKVYIYLQLNFIYKYRL